jgi:hypothetical protein
MQGHAFSPHSKPSKRRQQHPSSADNSQQSTGKGKRKSRAAAAAQLLDRPQITETAPA